MKKLFALSVFLFCITHLFAQVDTEFWFAPPEVSYGHGDSPILLQLSAMDENATIEIYQPALGNTPIRTINLAANESERVDLTSRKTRLETSPAFSVRNTGLYIKSDKPITAYYEVSSSWNVDIFVLKGKNGMGNNFIIPGQNQYDNGDYSPTPYYSFDIVATKNNTVVWINPSKSVLGHPAGQEYYIKLNRGQTYSVRRSTPMAKDHLGGSTIRSNKPIAVTLKDDSVIGQGGCRDLLGDQMVPVKVAGKEYVVVKGFLDAGEYVFITGIEDNTVVNIAGEDEPFRTINTGELIRYRLITNATHIIADKPIYVIHITGFGCEAGMALLPSVNCRGSSQISFTRSTSEFFGLNILVAKDGIENFRLNGRSDIVPASRFTAVPGTNDYWYAAQIELGTNDIAVNRASLISNSSHSFQIGIFNGGAGTSCRYGYFSAFATLFIGDDIALCPGETLELDAGTEKDLYEWSDGTSGRFFTVDMPGKYWVSTTKENCTLSDTITVNIKAAQLELGPEQTFCVGDTIEIDGEENFEWAWSDGSDSRYLNTTQPGTYSLEITNFTGCKASDDITVTHRETPTVDLGEDILKCPEEEVQLQASYPGATYFWNTGEETANIRVKDSLEYTVRVTYNNCFAYDTLRVSHLAGPEQDSIMGSPSVCPQVTQVDYFTEEIEGSNYQWFINGGTITETQEDSIKVDWGDTNADAQVSLIVTNDIGCESPELVFPVKVNTILDVMTPFGADSLCNNLRTNNRYAVGFTTGSSYEWFITDGEIISGQGTYEVNVDWNDEALGSLYVVERATTQTDVCDGTSDVLEVEVYEDTTSLWLDYSTVNSSSIGIYWNTNNPARIKDGLFYLTRWTDNTIDADWTKVTPATASSYQDVEVQSGESNYFYQLSGENICTEILASSIHSPILLTAEVDTVSGEVLLQWSPYQGWETIQEYEIYRTKDNTVGLLGTTTANLTEFRFNANDGFLHQILVRAKGSSNETTSSNLVTIELDHPIQMIPNAITPNNDGFNDAFIIPKIDLYPKAELIIMNRWGHTVYESSGYQNNWTGENQVSGTYFYQLKIPERNEIFKGYIQLIN